MFELAFQLNIKSHIALATNNANNMESCILGTLNSNAKEIVTGSTHVPATRERELVTVVAWSRYLSAK